MPGPGVEASPFLWTALAALCAGLAAGQALGAARRYAANARARAESSPGSAQALSAKVRASSGAEVEGRTPEHDDAKLRARGSAPRPYSEAGSGRLARALAFASLGILALAALLVL
ncbi:MAG: hypothetical protein M0Z80_08035, partial [Treponema sp.]|nr:hypothetical protein [Treponema sp.]